MPADVPHACFSHVCVHILLQACHVEVQLKDRSSGVSTSEPAHVCRRIYTPRQSLHCFPYHPIGWPIWPSACAHKCVAILRVLVNKILTCVKIVAGALAVANCGRKKCKGEMANMPVRLLATDCPRPSKSEFYWSRQPKRDFSQQKWHANCE